MEKVAAPGAARQRFAPSIRSVAFLPSFPRRGVSISKGTLLFSAHIQGAVAEAFPGFLRFLHVFFRCLYIELSLSGHFFVSANSHHPPQRLKPSLKRFELQVR